MEVLINKTTERGALVIQVDGELDMYTAPRLKHALGEGIDQGYKTLVVDLRQVGFLDSTALGVLVGSLRRLRAEEGDLRLIIDHPHLAKVFRITGFDGVFRISSDLDGALGPVQPAT